MYIWERCECEEQAWTQDETRWAAPCVAVPAWLTGLTPFEPQRLACAKNGERPSQVANQWITRALDTRSATAHNAPSALFFVGDADTGKTLLARHLANQAHAAGRRVAELEEIAFLGRYWSTRYEDMDALVDDVALRPWLLIVDGLGRHSDPPPSVTIAWARIIEQRAAANRWTVFTSRMTPPKLVRRNTIDEATERVLGRMIGTTLLWFKPDG